MPNPVESLRRIKCYSFSGPRPVKSTNNSIRCNFVRRPKIIQQIRQKAAFFEVFSKSIIYQLFKDFTKHRKKTNGTIVFGQRPLPNILR